MKKVLFRYFFNAFIQDLYYYIKEMSETRVKKYKDYRNSLIKGDKKIDHSFQTSKRTENVDEVLENRKVDSSSLSTLSISYDQIFEATNGLEEKEKINKKIRQKYIIKISAIVVGVVALIIAIVLTAVFLF